MPDNSERSGLHRQVERWLGQLGLNYVSERSFPPYQVDIYLPEWHLAVEIDGPAHLRKHDKARDAVLAEQYNLLVLRLGYKRLRRSQVMSAVQEFIERHADTAASRKISMAPR